MRLKVLIYTLIASVLFEMSAPLAHAKKRSDFLYLLFDCAPDYNYTVYVDGRKVSPPYKVKLFKKVPRSFEITTDEGFSYTGDIEAVNDAGDRTGKTFGYATCITPEILNRIQGETHIYVKNEKGKVVVKITLKRPKKRSERAE